MEMRQLEIFVQVADSSGFLAAAEQLHLSQSTVSAGVAALEQELQTQLIRRTTRTFALTEAGQKLYAYAADILSLQRRARRELAGKSGQTLQLGASSVPGQCLLPPLLAACREKKPQLRFEVLHGDSEDLIDMVAAGRLDAGFVGTRTAAACVFVPLAEDELVLVTPAAPAFRRLQQRGAPLAELLRAPFLLRDERSGTMQETLRFFASAGIDPAQLNVAARIADAETLRLCVAQGMGVSVLSAGTVQELAQQGRVLTFSLGAHALRRSLYLVYRQRRFQPGAAEEFLAFARAFFGAAEADAAAPAAK